jgi:monoterpene epsilon-lactone hydrolase
MSTEQREAIDRFYRQSEMPGSTPAELRVSFTRNMAHFAAPDGITTDDGTLAGRRALRITPTAGHKPGTILYFHGGAYMLGSPETALPATAGLVLRTGFTAVSVDYRLAPEHPYPAASEDALAAYRELLDSGVDPKTVALAGDSAGGWLAVVTALAARNACLPAPGAIVTFSALLDATYSGTSITTKADADPVISDELLAGVSHAFFAGVDPGRDLISPAIHGDLTGLAPILLQVGGNEMLLDDSVRMADRAAAAGVDAILDVTADVPHVFQLAAATLDEARSALDRAAMFITQHTTIPQ